MRRLQGWFASAGLGLLACNPTSQSSCPQSVSAAPGWDKPLGGLLVTGETSRCTMQLRLIDESPAGFSARLETANHCTGTLGLIPPSATLGVYVDRGYAQGIRFKAEFSQALETFRQIARSQGPGAEAFVDWGIFTISTLGGTARKASASQTPGTTHDARLEKQLLSYRSGCPTDLGSGKTLCATAADLLLETIFIERAELEGTHLASASTLAKLLQQLVPIHQNLLAAESTLQLAPATRPAGYAAKLLGAVQRRNHVERLQQILPLLHVSSTCTELRQADPNEIFGGMSGDTSGLTNSLVTAYSQRLLSQSTRAKAILDFCSADNGGAARQLQASLDAVTVSGGRTLAQLRSDFPQMNFIESDLEELGARVMEELKQNWQSIESHMASNFGQYAYATNAPTLRNGTDFSAAAAEAGAPEQFHHHPLTDLVKGEGESQALVRDTRNFGPVFVATTPDAYAVPWAKGSSGTVFSFHAGGVSVPLAALTAFDDSYTSGGVAVLPLPRSSSTSNTQGDLSPDDTGTSEQDTPTTSADLDGTAATRKGTRASASGSTCF